MTDSDIISSFHFYTSHNKTDFTCRLSFLLKIKHISGHRLEKKMMKRIWTLYLFLYSCKLIIRGKIQASQNLYTGLEGFEWVFLLVLFSAKN